MKSNMLIGFLIILVGTVFLGNNLEFWDVDIFFEGWWSLFIIVPGIISFFKGEFKTAIITVVIGIFLLLAARDVITWSLLWPVVIILIGFSVMIGSSPRKYLNKNGGYLAVFSESTNKVTGEFKETVATSVFGSVSIDLRKAEIKEDITLYCTCVFAGIDILVPDNVVVKVKGTPVFGGIDNSATGDKGKIITIDCICAFGGIDIK